MQFPSNINLETVNLQSYWPSFYSESTNLQQHGRTIPASRFECVLTTVPLNPSLTRQMFGFIQALQGRLNNFSIVLPGYAKSLGSASANGLVDGGVSAGDNTVLIKGLPTNQAKALVAGDPISFAGHRKVYTIAEDVSTDGTGTGIVKVIGNFKESLATNEVAHLVNVPFYFKQRTDKSIFDYRVGDQGYVKYRLDLVEDI